MTALDLRPELRASLPRVLLWELEKLTAQAKTRLAFAVCLLGPFGFAAGLRLAGTVPADTLFGRWVDDSGFAVGLVVLGFASSWGFPLLACLVAGDIFSAEDQHGTWKTILTRSARLRTLFAAKTVAIGAYVIAMIVVLASSSLAAGLLIEGSQPLVGLAGTQYSGSHAVWLVLLSWASVVTPTLSYAAFGVLLSIATRNSLVGILAPTVLGLATQLVTLVSMPVALRESLPGSAFLAWHGLFTEPRFLPPVARTDLVSVLYLLACLLVAWLILRRRDFDA